jgi:saccharopine dehydrogenase-like NADP-dependent oxidoreductase
LKTILLFGAGKSSTILIDYLLAAAAENSWQLIIADADKEQILGKTKHAPHAKAVQLDITNGEERAVLIQQADIVISLMPPDLHFLIAKDCVAFGKNLLTASYADEQLKQLAPEIKQKGLLFICELGLDPGIDHMSAMQRINAIKAAGGKIHAFKSHCGGLVAPENDDNPWRYKISWNPKNIMMAGKAGAVYKTDGKIIKENYQELFDAKRVIAFPGIGLLSFYPNRNSLGYATLYQLEDAPTFMRTTLRYPDFMQGWATIIALNLTDENIQYNTDGLSLQDFFKQHIAKGDLEKLSALAIKQLDWLGLNDSKTLINKGPCNVAVILQFMLENKLALKPADKDMIVMLHEIAYEQNGTNHYLQSSLIVTGENNFKTAMAKTVGLPLGIATKLILNEAIHLSGLHIPVLKEIYDPILKELRNYGIEFKDNLK